MGRRTWESLPDRFRPLPGRRNVVVTRNAVVAAPRARSVRRRSRTRSQLLGREERVIVIGGGELFAAALPLADELLLTEIDLDVEGDTFFPELGPSRVRGDVARAARLGGRHPFAFVTYVRRRGRPGREPSA